MIFMILRHELKLVYAMKYSRFFYHMNDFEK